METGEGQARRRLPQPPLLPTSRALPRTLALQPAPISLPTPSPLSRPPLPFFSCRLPPSLSLSPPPPPQTHTPIPPEGVCPYGAPGGLGGAGGRALRPQAGRGAVEEGGGIPASFRPAGRVDAHARLPKPARARARAHTAVTRARDCASPPRPASRRAATPAAGRVCLRRGGGAGVAAVMAD